MGRCQRWLLDFYVLYDDDTTETGNPHKKRRWWGEIYEFRFAYIEYWKVFDKFKKRYLVNNRTCKSGVKRK